jgi:hypothetical protein
MKPWAYLALLVLPGFLLPVSKVSTEKTKEVIPFINWNHESLIQSTVLIWSQRPTGITMTTGMVLDKERNLILATRHSVEKVDSTGKPAGLIEKVYVLWPARDQEGKVIRTSDYYFQQMRMGKIPEAVVVKEDVSRDIVVLKAGTHAPDYVKAIPIHQEALEPGTPLAGMAQPFTRGQLWHPFTVRITELIHRRLSYAQQGDRVALYLAEVDDVIEFGYSGSPMVMMSNGKLAALLLAAQLDKPGTLVLISSQEILQLLPIE